MDQNIRMELVLEGLDCANCAAKIERKVNDIESVSMASLNFASKTLIVEAKDSGSLESIKDKTLQIIKNIEPDVKVKEKNSIEETDDDDLNLRKAVITICMSAVLFGTAKFIKLPFYIEISLFVISYLLVGGSVLIKAAKNIIRGQLFDENFLMAVATLGAFSIGQYPEGVAVMLFYSVGELFQDLAVNRSRKSIASLMDIRPDYANLKKGDDISKVSPEEVSIGDIILIKPGEKIPLDGVVVDGKSMVDTSALTGESVPRDVETGSEVLGGFINKNGLLSVRVSKEFSESTVSKILDLVQNAANKKAPTENFITKFARIYTPAVVGAAFLLAVIPPLVVKGALFSEWLYRALVFLMISCPCALVISVPLSFFGGIGAASKNGILIKGGNYLECLKNIDTLVFDKTGTLTKGVFNVTSINVEDGFTSDELLEMTAFCESYSNHPIALSILSAYGKEIKKDIIDSYEEISGTGIVSYINGRKVLAGNEKLMNAEKIVYKKPNNDTGTIVYVAIDGLFAGSIVISDELKDDSIEGIKKLKNAGVKNTVMLTGDSRHVAEAVSKALGIDAYYGELLPDQKVEMFEKLQNKEIQGQNIAFVGDGINDAPVLARSDVGIAMGGLGSDAAIEASDVVIMNDEISKIADAIKIAKKTKRIVWENIILALGVKITFLILAAFGISTMWEAVIADVGVALLAVVNSLRAMKFDKEV